MVARAAKHVFPGREIKDVEGRSSLATTMDRQQKGRANGTRARPLERLTSIPQDNPPRLVGRPCASASDGERGSHNRSPAFIFLSLLSPEEVTR